MFCSTIIPTVNRPTLSRAVKSVLDQEFGHDDYEVIVVNDSGQPLSEADWQQSPRVRVIETNQRERSVARNAGAAIARGEYLHFLDDDDWITPDALKKFWDLANTSPSQAGWLYGGYRLVDNEGNAIKDFYPVYSGNCLAPLIAGEWLPLQASLVRAKAFFEIGGFASLDSLSGGGEDTDLTRLVGLYYELAYTANLVAIIRRGLIGSTTNYSNFQDQLRQSREKILKSPGAFERLRASAKEQPNVPDYWVGKSLWYYLASAKWNVKYKRPFTALSRLVSFLLGFILAGRYIFSIEFWRGLTKPFYPRAFQNLPPL